MTLKTPLYDQHIAAGAKMGPFAGYDMPLYYTEGVIKEHEWVRSSAGLFDVSHMGQVFLEGAGSIPFLETITPSSYGKAAPGLAKYTVLTNEAGGIVDDLIVTKLTDQNFFTVINAGCKEKDIAWMTARLPATGVTLMRLDDRALLALQGPRAELALRDALGVNTAELGYMRFMTAGELFISRLGYTGEDGFEISMPQQDAATIWQKLLAHAAVKPIGLAARDSLRLEMGYPLYGHDINDDTSPVEAGIQWVIGKTNTGFIGAPRVLKDLSGGVSRARVGLRLTGKGIAREGAEIRNMKDETIGAMTSGGHSPSLKISIGMGYVPPDYAGPGTKVFVNVRGNNIAAEICAMPFVPARTKSAKKNEAA